MVIVDESFVSDCGTEEFIKEEKPSDVLVFLERYSSEFSLHLERSKVVEVDIFQKVLEDLALLDDLADSEMGILLPVHLGDAGPVAAVVVDQNVIILALEADVSEVVGFTAQNIHIAFAIIQMVVGDALFASRSVQREG